MTYVESIFVLLACPLLASLPFLEGRPRSMISLTLAGMLSCLLSAYVNAFYIRAIGVDAQVGAVEVAPLVEESIKLLPLLFYLLVFEPEMREARTAVVFVAVGFATMESGFYLADSGLTHPMTLALRGLSASVMHLSCGVVVGYGLTRVWSRTWLKVAGTFGLLVLAMTYHGVYNLLVAAGGAAQVVAIILPMLTLVVLLVWRGQHRRALRRR